MDKVTVLFLHGKLTVISKTAGCKAIYSWFSHYLSKHINVLR